MIAAMEKNIAPAAGDPTTAASPWKRSMIPKELLRYSMPKMLSRMIVRRHTNVAETHSPRKSNHVERERETTRTASNTRVVGSNLGPTFLFEVGMATVKWMEPPSPTPPRK